MSHEVLNHIADRIFSVTEYLELVNELIAPLSVSVEGEVTDLKLLPQWTFFSLKDAESGALLPCGLHSGQYRRIGVNLEEGMRVKILGYGKIQVKSGRFGFWVSHIEPVGEGALRRAYELLIKKMQEEGLFARKRELPTFIQHIGVISSRNGVVLQDLRRNLRALGIRIDFLHSGVEGADSAGELLRAIEHFSRTTERPDVLVLIRGGGSLESLQGFNNEAVCRALFASPIPVLVGIGHDVDAPIATLVADWSASTPTAVAHVINDSWSPLTERMPLCSHTIGTAFRARLRTVMRGVPHASSALVHRFRMRVQTLEHRSVLASQIIRHAMSRVTGRFDRYAEVLALALKRAPARLRATEQDLERALRRSCERFASHAVRVAERVVGYERLIAAGNPERVLARGYGLVFDSRGALVRSVQACAMGDTLRVTLRDGTVEGSVTGVTTQAK